MLRASLAQAFNANLNVGTFPDIVLMPVKRAFVPLSVIGALTITATSSVHLAVTKLGFSLKKLTPDISRLNPVGKIRNMAFQGPAALLQASAMLVLFSAAIYSIAKQNADLLFTLPFTSLDTGLLKVGASIKDILWKAAAMFLCVRLHRSDPPESANLRRT